MGFEAAFRLNGLRRMRRTARDVLRKQLRPPRPPMDSPAAVAAFSVTPDEDWFITGNRIAAHCRYVLNYDVLAVNEEIENDWWFCKADYLEYFFRKVAPKTPFVLFSHNSDRAIGRRFRRALARPALRAWFAQNPVLRHPKLRALPIGIANPRWAHGDQAALRRVQREHVAKERLFNVSFSLDTNPGERQHCLAVTQLELAPKRPFETYLQELAGSYFCISPQGNGIDCARTWEALYLRTVPVVTRSLVTEHHSDLPMIVLDDWSQFGSIQFSPKLYERVWGNWDPDELRVDRYLARIERHLPETRS